MEIVTNENGKQVQDSEYIFWNDSLEVIGETILALLAAMKNIDR